MVKNVLAGPESTFCFRKINVSAQLWPCSIIWKLLMLICKLACLHFMHWESSPVSPDELNALFMWLWHSVALFSFFIQISFAGSPCKSGTHLSVIYAQAAILIKHAWRLCFLCTNPKRNKNSQWMTGIEHRLQSDWACGGHCDLSFSLWWQDKKKSHNRSQKNSIYPAKMVSKLKTGRTQCISVAFEVIAQPVSCTLTIA